MSAVAHDPLAFLKRTTALLVQHDVDANRDLTVRQFAILLDLVDRPEPAPSIRHLASQFGLSRPATTKSVDRLVDVLGFASRVPSANDRRSVEIRITTAGRAFVSGLVQALRSAPAAGTALQEGDHPV